MTKRLYRSNKNKIIGGVAGGLSDYLNIEPLIVRIIFVFASFLNGTGILLYIILWIVVPLKSQNRSEGESGDSGFSETQEDNDGIKNGQSNKSNGIGRIVIGLLFIGTGLIFLIDRFFPHFDFGDVFPFLIIAIGVALILNSAKSVNE